MTEGVCPTCGGLTSTPMYRCRCAADERPMVSPDLTQDELRQLRDLLRGEGLPSKADWVRMNEGAP